MKTYTILIFFFISISLSAQIYPKHDYNWIRGYDFDLGIPGGEGNLFNFNESPVSISFIEKEFDLILTSASISDSLGNLLFYTNGCHIIDATHQIMMNGDSINPGEIHDNNCGTIGGYTVDQGAIILPISEMENMYMLFHQRKIFTTNPFDPEGVAIDQLMYSLVDMSLNNGLGEVIEKNETAIADTLDGELLTAVKHANGKDWWVVSPRRFQNKYANLLLTSNGIENVFDQEIGMPSSVSGSGSGQAVFSPDGIKYARYNKTDQVYLMDFDRETGLFSNFEQVVVADTTSVGGIAISPNSRYMYVSSTTKLYQFDLWSSDIEASRELIATWDGFRDGSFPTTFNLMQLGPDCRIYMNNTSSTRYMHVIMQPDLGGVACDFLQHGIMTEGWNSFDMPNFPNYRLGATPSYPCDSTIQLDIFVDVEELLDEPVGFKIYPNPASEEVTIEFSEEEIRNRDNVSVVLFNQLGQEVMNENIRRWQDDLNLDISKIPNGIYFVVLMNADLKYQPQRIIISR